MYIHFIINPVSGNAKHNLEASYLLAQFPKEQFRIKIEYTKEKKHALELTKAAVFQNPDYIVACGGDGTINEVASCLVGTNIKLGIIPLGSGKGLASNLNIPRDLEKAIIIIKKGDTTSIDVGKINQYYFFSYMGIGIDALIIKKCEHSENRTLSSYVKATICSVFEFKAQKAIVSYEGKIIEVNPFMLFISNSNEISYDRSLTPKVNLRDGILHMVIIPELSFFEKINLGINVLRNTIEKFKLAQQIPVREVRIEMPQKKIIDVQIDGEQHNLKTNIIEVRVLPKSLKVLV